MKHILEYPSVSNLVIEAKRRELQRKLQQRIEQCKKDHQTDPDLIHVHRST